MACGDVVEAAGDAVEATGLEGAASERRAVEALAAALRKRWDMPEKKRKKI